jgi:uncharacterized membrane protein YagU involved in acid resistance
MMQTYAHHICAITGNVGGIASGGFFGSISHLTWITEASTPFVNLRQLLAWHHLTDNRLYLMNGLLMTLSFFVFRIVFYTYMILGQIFPFVLDGKGSFYAEYPGKGQ